MRGRGDERERRGGERKGRERGKGDGRGEGSSSFALGRKTSCLYVK